MADAARRLSELEANFVDLDAKLTQLHAEMAEQTASYKELKTRLTELAGIATAQAMSIDEKLDELLNRLPTAT
jgi:predicted transcriptional regulator